MNYSKAMDFLTSMTSLFSPTVYTKCVKDGDIGVNLEGNLHLDINLGYEFNVKVRIESDKKAYLILGSGTYLIGWTELRKIDETVYQSEEQFLESVIGVNPSNCDPLVIKNLLEVNGIKCKLVHRDKCTYNPRFRHGIGPRFEVIEFMFHGDKCVIDANDDTYYIVGSSKSSGLDSANSSSYSPFKLIHTLKELKD